LSSPSPSTQTRSSISIAKIKENQATAKRGFVLGHPRQNQASQQQTNSKIKQSRVSSKRGFRPSPPQTKSSQVRTRFSPRKAHPRRQRLRNQGQHIHQGKSEITDSNKEGRQRQKSTYGQISARQLSREKRKQAITKGAVEQAGARLSRNESERSRTRNTTEITQNQAKSERVFRPSPRRHPRQNQR